MFEECFSLFDFSVRRFRKQVKLKRTNISRQIWEIIIHPLFTRDRRNSIWFSTVAGGSYPSISGAKPAVFPP